MEVLLVGFRAMALLKGTSKAELVSPEAQTAWDEGRKFFIWEAGSSFRSATKGVAEALETIESVGWKLDQMSYVFSSTLANHPVGYFLFRR